MPAARKHYVFWIALTLILLAGTVISLQQPWRSKGARHIVKGFVTSGVQIYVVQEHDGHGPYDTYLVAQSSDGGWNWFPFSHDDLYWRTVRFTPLTNDNVMISKYGIVFAEFSPKNFTINARGQTDYYWKRTADLLADK